MKIRTRLLLLALLPVPAILVLASSIAINAFDSLRDSAQAVLQTQQLAAADALFQSIVERWNRQARAVSEQSRGLESLLFGDGAAVIDESSSGGDQKYIQAEAAAAEAFQRQITEGRNSGLSALLGEVENGHKQLLKVDSFDSIDALVSSYGTPLQRFADLPALASSLSKNAEWGQRFSQLAALSRLQAALALERLLVHHALTSLQVDPSVGRVLATAESRVQTLRSSFTSSREQQHFLASSEAALIVADKAGRASLLTSINEYSQRAELLSQLLEGLGYGGFIHSFKDYQLRGDRADLSRASVEIATAQETIRLIAALPMSDTERRDVDTVAQALSDFQKLVNTPGKASQELDDESRAADLATIDALKRLRSFRAAMDIDRWEAISTRLQAEVAQGITLLLDQTAAEAGAERSRLKLLTTVSAAAVLLTLLLMFAVGRQLYLRLSGGIRALVEEFQRVADSGDVRTRIVVDGNDELAELNRYFERLGESLGRYEAENARARQLSLSQLSILAATRTSAGLQEMAAAMLSQLRHQCDAVVGAAYVRADNSFKPLAEIGMPTGHDFFTAGLSQGLVGLAKDADSTLVLAKLPPGFLRLASGTGAADTPVITLTPLRAFGQTVGVIELGWLSPPTDTARELLDRVSEPLGIAMTSTISRVRTEALLAETRAQSEQLQQQQEELRTSNEELAEQAAILRQSEEELRAQREQLQSSNQDLEETAQQLERQREQLQQTARDLEMATRYKSDFLANMSHELRTPLNSLLILSRQLAQNDEGNLNSQQLQAAEIIHSGGKDLLTLINDILDLSKVEAGKMDLHVDALLLADLLSDLRRQFEPVARERGLEFITEIDPALPASILTDRNRLQQVLRNLLANAFKFTSQGRVQLVVSRPSLAQPIKRFDDPATAIAFRITDTGIGIPNNKLEDIFEAFRQADGSTSRKYGGTGLGLNIARQLSSLLGGEVHVQSEVGVGSSFTVIVPERLLLSADEVTAVSPATPRFQEVPAPKLIEEASGETAPAIEDDRADSRDGARTILVIEDDLNFAAIVRDLVRKQGFKCLVAADGRSGLSLAKRYQPGAIILDLNLPDSEGLSVLETLKFSGATRHIPVHIVSASDPTTEALRRGAIGFIRKPADREALIAVVQKLAVEIEREQHTVLLIEDDRNSQVAVRGLLGNDQTRVLVASTGAEALRLLGTEEVHCVVLDLSLPDTDGIDFLEKLHLNPELPHPPSVVYTGRELSVAEHRRLSTLAQSIVIKGAASPERLLDEVVLFLHEVEEKLPAEQRQIVSRLHRGSDAFAGKKLLVVDDDLRNSFALSSVLKQRGFEVLIADNGQLALDRLAENDDIDAVLMDIMMPVMDGLEATRRLRANPRHARLPVIALTARAMGDDRRKCLEAGASDYLSKPVDIDQLLGMLRVWLGRPL
ncbi:MAG: response regulator [Pseudomonadota bacterium]